MSMNEIFGVPEKRPQVTGPQEGRVTKVTGDGVFFKIPTYSDSIEFGPARLSAWAKATEAAGDVAHVHTVVNEAPPTGALCLVLFAGPGLQRPWVVGWV